MASQQGQQGYCVCGCIGITIPNTIPPSTRPAGILCVWVHWNHYPEYYTTVNKASRDTVCMGALESLSRILYHRQQGQRGYCVYGCIGITIPNTIPQSTRPAGILCVWVHWNHYPEYYTTVNKASRDTVCVGALESLSRILYQLTRPAGILCVWVHGNHYPEYYTTVNKASGDTVCVGALESLSRILYHSQQGQRGYCVCGCIGITIPNTIPPSTRPAGILCVCGCIGITIPNTIPQSTRPAGILCVWVHGNHYPEYYTTVNKASRDTVCVGALESLSRILYHSQQGQQGYCVCGCIGITIPNTIPPSTRPAGILCVCGCIGITIPNTIPVNKASRDTVCMGALESLSRILYHSQQGQQGYCVCGCIGITIPNTIPQSTRPAGILCVWVHWNHYPEYYTTVNKASRDTVCVGALESLSRILYHSQQGQRGYCVCGCIGITIPNTIPQSTRPAGILCVWVHGNHYPEYYTTVNKASRDTVCVGALESLSRILYHSQQGQRGYCVCGCIGITIPNTIPQSTRPAGILCVWVHWNHYPEYYTTVNKASGDTVCVGALESLSRILYHSQQGQRGYCVCGCIGITIPNTIPQSTRPAGILCVWVHWNHYPEYYTTVNKASRDTVCVGALESLSRILYHRQQGQQGYCVCVGALESLSRILYHSQQGQQGYCVCGCIGITIPNTIPQSTRPAGILCVCGCIGITIPNTIPPSTRPAGILCVCGCIGITIPNTIPQSTRPAGILCVWVHWNHYPEYYTS